MLLAAAVRFAQTSYEEVKLRDIARDVGVDVAYVHRSFGSKENLFAEVLRATAVHPRDFTARESKDFVSALTESIFDRNSAALGVVVNSLSSPQARNMLRSFAFTTFVEPLAANLPEPALERAALIAACLTGVRVVRDVLGLEPLHSGSRKITQPLIEAIFRACLAEIPPIPRETAGSTPARPDAPRAAAKSRDARRAGGGRRGPGSADPN
jgi:AcrR family transcriptional regulator